MASKTKATSRAGLGAALAKYKAARDRYEAAVADYDEEREEEYNERCTKCFAPAKEARLRLRKEFMSLHEIGEWDKPRAVVFGGDVVVMLDPGWDCNGNGIEAIEAADVLTLDADGQAGTMMRLTRDELTVVEAMRAKRGTFRPDVIAGFKTPTNAGELREIVRLMLDCCTPIMATSQGECEIDIAYEDGADASIVISDEALGVAPASTLYRPVEKYRRPTNPDELKQLIRSFLESEFAMTVGGLADSSGLEIDLNVEGGCDLVRLVAGRPEEFEAEPEKPEPADEAARKMVYYRRPRDQDEFADVLQAMVTNELGMEVAVCMDEDGPERYSDKDQPKPWIYMSLDGLDRDSRTSVYLAILKGHGLLTVVNGEGELELLKQYRARLKSLDLDERSAHLVDDRMPEGYTFDLLRADEVGALEAHRCGRTAPKETGSPTTRLLRTALEMLETAKGHQRDCLHEILHTVVVMNHGGRGDDWSHGPLAVQVDGKLVSIDAGNGLPGDEKWVHVIDAGDVSNLGDEVEASEFFQPAAN